MEHVNAIAPVQKDKAPAAAEVKAASMDEIQLKQLSSFKGLPVQFKLSVGAQNDPLEHEADAMADHVMRMPSSNFVQRKCSHCEEEEKVQRKPLSSFVQRKSTEGATVASESLSSRILAARGNGSSLDNNTKSFMERGFGADFSHVRIHTGSESVQMNRELNAKAFTAGNDIYFNDGQYQPGSSEGNHLLAHELTHTIQQAGGLNNFVQKTGDDEIEVDIMTVDPKEAKQLHDQQGITLPGAGVVWSLPSPALVTRIRTILTQNGITPPALRQTAISNPEFVLHDTAIAMGATAISNAAASARGPLGGGAAAYVPATGNATVARSNFFDRRRPTATEFEKGNDLLTLQTRLTNSRIIWQNTNATVRQTAMQTVLAGLNLTPAEITTETNTAVAELNSSVSSSSLVHSTGIWTANEICNQLNAAGIQQVVNNPANVATLQAAVNIMMPFFTTRNDRIESRVNVEIVQNTGSNCSTTGSRLPAYTANQYMNVSLLYLQAVLQAGRFPKITTHFLVDKGAGSHCDPRCFNVGQLYQNISTHLTFPASTTYGIIPQYGSGASDNVWWSNTVCGGTHP